MAWSLLCFAHGKSLGPDGINWLNAIYFIVTKKREPVSARLVYADNPVVDGTNVTPIFCLFFFLRLIASVDSTGNKVVDQVEQAVVNTRVNIGATERWARKMLIPTVVLMFVTLRNRTSRTFQSPNLSESAGDVHISKRNSRIVHGKRQIDFHRCMRKCRMGYPHWASGSATLQPRIKIPATVDRSYLNRYYDVFYS